MDKGHFVKALLNYPEFQDTFWSFTYALKTATATSMSRMATSTPFNRYIPARARRMAAEP
jgi:hypothetical protein